MRRLSSLMVVLAIAAMAATPAWAQGQGKGKGGRGGFGGRGGLGGPAMLLGQKSVQEELKLTEDQLKSVQEMQAKQREVGQSLRDLSPDERRQKVQEMAKANQEAIAKILKADQMKRLTQISYQQQGAGAFGDPEVAKALELGEDQKEKIKAIQEDGQRAMQELFQSGGGGGDPQEARKKGLEIRTRNQEKIMKLLRDEQTAKWKDLTGEPFKGEIQFGGGFGGGGQKGKGGKRDRN